MDTNNSLSLLSVATVLWFTVPALASAGPVADLAREQRLANQTADAILDGEAAGLQAITPSPASKRKRSRHRGTVPR